MIVCINIIAYEVKYQEYRFKHEWLRVEAKITKPFQLYNQQIHSTFDNDDDDDQVDESTFYFLLICGMCSFKVLCGWQREIRIECMYLCAFVFCSITIIFHNGISLSLSIESFYSLFSAAFIFFLPVFPLPLHFTSNYYCYYNFYTHRSF